jgi:hypothetical protein
MYVVYNVPSKNLFHSNLFIVKTKMECKSHCNVVPHYKGSLFAVSSKLSVCGLLSTAFFYISTDTSEKMLLFIPFLLCTVYLVWGGGVLKKMWLNSTIFFLCNRIIQGYGIGVQIVCDIKNCKMKLMDFEGTVTVVLELATARLWKCCHVKRLMLPFFSGSSRNKQKKYQSSVPCVNRNPRVFTKLLDWKLNLVPVLDGWPDPSNDIALKKLLCREGHLLVPLCGTEVCTGRKL